ncbi:MAG: DUF1559 domain-containing protein [Pirellulaceae bacterium]|nr:DUF1559 domain-containing protein [Pirellulaceae bacterium]
MLFTNQKQSRLPAILVHFVMLNMVLGLAGCQEAKVTQEPGQGNEQLTPQPETEKKPAEEPVGTEEKAALDLSYIPATAMAAVILAPQRILDSEAAQLYPTEVLEVFSKRATGVSVMDIEQGIVLLQMSENSPVPMAGAIVRLSKPASLEALFPLLKEDPDTWQQVEVDGRPAIRFTDPSRGPVPMSFEVTMPDDKTVLIGMAGFLAQMLAAKDADSPLIKLLAQVDANDELVAVASADMLPEPLQQAMVNPNLVPPLFAQYTAALKYLSAVEISVSIGAEWGGELVIHSHDPDQAEALQAVIVQGLSMAKQTLLSQVNVAKSGDEMIDAAMAKYQVRIGNYLEQMFRPTRDGKRLTMNSNATIGVASTGVLVALLLPAVQSARHAARRMSSSNNLKQIGIALHNYHDSYKQFPVGESPTNKYKDGKPLLSWRVHLLPYLDQEPLYNKFKMDEPWDSPHNIQLLDQIPPVYVCPHYELGNRTVYQAPQGANTALGSGERVRFRDITDGTSQTIAVIEAGPERAVPWTKPDGLTLDADDPVGSVAAENETFQVLFCDGSVQAISTAISADIFKWMTQINDGHPINRNEEE